MNYLEFLIQLSKIRTLLKQSASNDVSLARDVLEEAMVQLCQLVIQDHDNDGAFMMMDALERLRSATSIASSPSLPSMPSFAAASSSSTNRIRPAANEIASKVSELCTAYKIATPAISFSGIFCDKLESYIQSTASSRLATSTSPTKSWMSGGRDRSLTVPLSPAISRELIGRISLELQAATQSSSTRPLSDPGSFSQSLALSGLPASSSLGSLNSFIAPIGSFPSGQDTFSFEPRRSAFESLSTTFDAGSLSRAPGAERERRMSRPDPTAGTFGTPPSTSADRLGRQPSLTAFASSSTLPPRSLGITAESSSMMQQSPTGRSLARQRAQERQIASETLSRAQTTGQYGLPDLSSLALASQSMPPSLPTQNAFSFSPTSSEAQRFQTQTYRSRNSPGATYGGDSQVRSLLPTFSGSPLPNAPLALAPRTTQMWRSGSTSTPETPASYLSSSDQLSPMTPNTPAESLWPRMPPMGPPMPNNTFGGTPQSASSSTFDPLGGLNLSTQSRPAPDMCMVTVSNAISLQSSGRPFFCTVTIDGVKQSTKLADSSSGNNPVWNQDLMFLPQGIVRAMEVQVLVKFAKHDEFVGGNSMTFSQNGPPSTLDIPMTLRRREREVGRLRLQLKYERNNTTGRLSSMQLPIGLGLTGQLGF